MQLHPNMFGALPPEINSGRMYAGVGSGPLLAAATAWDGLAAELGSAASGYQAVLSGLTGLHWRGPTSVKMIAAVTPYVAWLKTTASQAEQTGLQARAAAAAYEAAFAMTVPPPVIAANRMLLLSLIATNFFGQNAGAIAATEAEYAEFWAQDAAAMSDYAETSAAASTLTPFGPPPNNTKPNGFAERLPILPTNDWNALVNTWGLAYFGIGIIQLATMFAQQFLPEAAGTPVGAAAAESVSPPLAATFTATVAAGRAQSGSVGLMSVPPSWVSSTLAKDLRSQAISETIEPASITPSWPVSAVSPMNEGRTAAFGRRRYGRRFKVMPHPPTGI